MIIKPATSIVIIELLHLLLGHNIVEGHEKKGPGQQVQGQKSGRARRQVYMGLNLPKEDDDDDDKIKKAPRPPTAEQVQCTSDIFSGEIETSPLMCYQCENFSNDTEPTCDMLWPSLSIKEKKALEVRCPETHGTYCVKTVRRFDHGVIKTARGCYGQGPVQTHIDGRNIDIRPGCITYYAEDSLSTICFCLGEELCNSASRRFIQAQVKDLLFIFFSTFIPVSLQFPLVFI